MTVKGDDMRKLLPITGLLAILFVLSAQPAEAYIGPGAGITMLGALWGVIVAVALALGAVLFWPRPWPGTRPPDQRPARQAPVRPFSSGLAP
jgi:hypothetical protein